MIEHRPPVYVSKSVCVFSLSNRRPCFPAEILRRKAGLLSTVLSSSVNSAPVSIVFWLHTSIAVSLAMGFGDGPFEVNELFWGGMQK